jgi:hypothetical protein
MNNLRITASKQNLRRSTAQMHGWTLAANFACLQSVCVLNHH